MMLGAALCYAISWLLVKHKMAGAAPEAIAGGTMFVAAVVTAPLLVASPPAAAPAFDSVASLVALGIGGTGIAFVLFYTLIAEIGPARAAMVELRRARVLDRLRRGPARRVADDRVDRGLGLILAGSWLGAQGRLPGFLSRSGPSRSSAPAPARAR